MAMAPRFLEVKHQDMNTKDPPPPPKLDEQGRVRVNIRDAHGLQAILAAHCFLFNEFLDVQLQ